MRTLDVAPFLIGLLLVPSTVSAPMVLSHSPGADASVHKGYRDLARILYELHLQEQNLKLHRQVALADEKHVSVDPRSSTLRLNWGRALLKECGFRPENVSALPAGVASVSSKGRSAIEPIRLSNGVQIRDVAHQDSCVAPCIRLAREDLLAILDFVDIGSTIIWEF